MGLEERMLQLRGTPDYKLSNDGYAMFMLDGRSFSKYCKGFRKPFDNVFVDVMNETAKYLCENIEGCKFAYAQSDEISLFIDRELEEMSQWFSYRLCKLLSISASLASSKFNQLMIIETLKKSYNLDDAIIKTEKLKLAEFDSKAWNVPSKNDVFSWFLYRQLDCVRNSKQMLAQKYFSSKSLSNLTTDQQADLVRREYGISWDELEDGVKYGRFIYKEELVFEKDEVTFKRNKWIIHDAFPLYDETGRSKFFKLNLFNDYENDV